MLSAREALSEIDSPADGKLPGSDWYNKPASSCEFARLGADTLDRTGCTSRAATNMSERRFDDFKIHLCFSG